MTAVPISYTLHYNYKDSIYPTQKVFGSNKMGCNWECAVISKNSTSPSVFDRKRWEVSYPAVARAKTRRGFNAYKEENWNGLTLHSHQNNGVLVIKVAANHKNHMRYSLKCDSQARKLCNVWYASESTTTNEKQLRSLASYFGRLQGDENKKVLDSSAKTGEALDTGQITAKKGLELLDAYFEKVDEDADVNSYALSTFDEQHEGNLFSTSSPFEDFVREEEETLTRHEKLSDMIKTRIPETTQLQEDEISDLYLISTLISINIAVFLFEIASPVKNSDLELFSLPSLYGAKINQLIMVGEWWRLVTPMFLHTGFIHVALSCWALLTFGRKVCRGYGPFAFFLIYVLGGVSGNLTSFLHTPEPTVGGTGPVFAMLGAWLVYQFQNKDVVAKDVSDNMFLKAIIAAVISSILSNMGPIDEWTHTGAAFTGMLYGFFTSPAIQVDDTSSSRRGQEGGIKLVRKYADPCKSLALFTLFIIGMSCLLFFIEPPLNTIASSYTFQQVY